MNKQEQHNADVQFMRECVISEVVKLLMEKKDLDMETAIMLFYSSDTAKKLDNEQTKLYTQSPLYLFDMLMSEINFETLPR